MTRTRYALSVFIVVPSRLEPSGSWGASKSLRIHLGPAANDTIVCDTTKNARFVWKKVLDTFSFVQKKEQQTRRTTND